MQVNLYIDVFSDALRSEAFVKTLNAFISKLYFENVSQDFSGTTGSILLKFTGIVQKKYYLVSQESFLKKKICCFIYEKLINNGGKIKKKKFKHLPFAQKNASWLTALTLLKQ